MTYEFSGKHYICSFKEIALPTPLLLKEIVMDALTLCGATILKYDYHLFNNNAITFVFLLSESHCTVHTYPEYQSLFIDSFTCGNNFDIQRFHDLLTWRFKPKELPQYQIINRN
jgi:S-adenosylmethionine decarboxylase